MEKLEDRLSHRILWRSCDISSRSFLYLSSSPLSIHLPCEFLTLHSLFAFRENLHCDALSKYRDKELHRAPSKSKWAAWNTKTKTLGQALFSSLFCRQRFFSPVFLFPLLHPIRSHFSPIATWDTFNCASQGGEKFSSLPLFLNFSSKLTALLLFLCPLPLISFLCLASVNLYHFLLAPSLCTTTKAQATQAERVSRLSRGLLTTSESKQAAGTERKQQQNEEKKKRKKQKKTDWKSYESEKKWRPKGKKKKTKAK